MTTRIITIAGFIGLAIASGLSTSLVIAVFGLAWWGRPLAEPGAEIMSVVVTGMVAALNTIVGALVAYFSGKRVHD